MVWFLGIASVVLFSALWYTLKRAADQAPQLK